MSLFWYKRKELSKKSEKDSEGKDVVKEIVTIFWDCLNTDCIVRGLWKNDKVFAVLMNDGHEQAEDRQKPVFKNGKPAGYEVKRERDWFYSQIELDAEDTERLWNGKLHPGHEEFLGSKGVQLPKGQLISEGAEAVILD